MSTLDLASLPAPTVIEVLSFEEYYQQALDEFRGLMGANWTAALESDPVVKLLERAAYEKLMTRARINDAAKAQLVAYARKTDLDHGQALDVVVGRQVIEVGFARKGH